MFVAMHTSTCSRAPSLPLLLTDLGSAPSPLAPTPHTLHAITVAMLTPTRPSNYLHASPGDFRCSPHTRLLAAPALPLLLTDLGCRTLPNPQKPRGEAQTQRGNCENEAQTPRSDFLTSIPRSPRSLSAYFDVPAETAPKRARSPLAPTPHALPAIS
jgi:hypothetical protein